MRLFWSFYWWLWFGLLVVGDPIANWLGDRAHVGGEYTDTHLIVSHLNTGLRCAVLAWLCYHFLVANH
jgi:hypothetical protein